MRPQISAILAIDDRAAGCAGVALVGSDQLQRIAEQFDMLVIDRCDAGQLRADQAHRIVTAADAGLEHRAIAIPLLKIQAGQREQGLEGSEFFSGTPRDFGYSLLDPRLQPRQVVIADISAVDLNPFVPTIQMRRGEQTGSQAIGACDAGAERRGRAFAIGPRHDNRNTRQPCPVHRERIEQVGHPCQANPVTVFWKVKHYSSPVAENVWCQIFRIRSPRPDSSSSRIEGLAFTSITRIASGSPPIPVNMSTAPTRSPSARAALLASTGAASDGGASSIIVPPALRFMRPGIDQRSPLGSTMSSAASGVAETGERPRERNASSCAINNSPIDRTPSPDTNGGYFLAQYTTSSSSRKIRYSFPVATGWISIES